MISGDFRSEESVELLKECDIVVMNPPFSLFGKFIELLDKYGKQFLVVGPLISIGTRNVLNMYMDDKLWLGKTLRFTNTIKLGPTYLFQPWFRLDSL